VKKWGLAPAAPSKSLGISITGRCLSPIFSVPIFQPQIAAGRNGEPALPAGEKAADRFNDGLRGLPDAEREELKDIEA
jgi:hypothetical protein